MQSFKIAISDHLQVQAYTWLPKEKPLAILQIAHGMMEHAWRYDNFASWLNEKGVAVYANDHIGHGSTASSEEELCHFPDKDDWQRSVDILHKINENIRHDHPGVPVVMLGHSMGSVLVQSYMIRYGEHVNSYILSGVIRQPMFMANMGSVLTAMLSSLYGRTDRSKFLVSMGYGQYNKQFKPNRTEFDWLSRDTEIVDEYVNSPLCGVPLTNGFYRCFFQGLTYIACRRNLMEIQAGKKVLIIAGKKDPAGSFGKTPVEIGELLTKFAKAEVELKLYPESRHEILNEINREEVYEDVFQWIRKSLKIED